MDNATSSRGVGEVHTVYLCSRTRKCDTCGKRIQDNVIIDQLPQPQRRLMPVERSAASGLPSAYMNLVLALFPSGVPFSLLARAANNLSQSNHAENRLALYGMLQRHAQPMGQESFLYPRLDKATIGLNASYLIERYLDAVEPMLECHRLVQGSYSGFILKLDGAFKVGHR